MELHLGFVLMMCQLWIASSKDVVVETTNGKVRGETDAIDGLEYTRFLGIPYGAPPVGSLRFRPPQKPDKWLNEIYDAKTTRPSCPQMSGFNITFPYFPKRVFEKNTEDEDCLHLNIYAPGDISDSRDALLPVMVFIHGGGFTVGDTTPYNGDVLATFAEPAVHVSMQYRLATLGFLTSGDDALPGNLGFMDQSLALAWVKENIAAFGGDPDHVTISGESAGGESVLAHVISPMSAGLFHKAIAQSAPPTWIYPEKQAIRHHFETFAKALECEKATSEEIVECLREKPWQDIVQADAMTVEMNTQRVIDGEFIPANPTELWTSGQFNDVDLVIGFTSDDGAAILDYWLKPDFNTNRTADREMMTQVSNLCLTTQLSSDKIPKDGKIRRGEEVLTNGDDLTTLLKGRYFDSAQNELDRARGILDCVRDGFFVVHSLFAANTAVRKGNPVRMYVFDHRCSEYPDGDMELGAPHASELPFQFGYGFSDPDEVAMTTDELTLSRSLMHAWTSFAAGHASYLTMGGDKVEWPQYSTDKQNILVFNTDMSEDSVIDGAEHWQPVLDFWLAIHSSAQFSAEADETTEDGSNEKDEL